MLILNSLYLFLPGILSNTLATVTYKYTFLKRFNWPVDFGIKLNGNYLFGKTKTWKGIILGTLTGIFVIYLQRIASNFTIFNEISLIDYNNENVILIGSMMGLGAMIGDLIKSFFKRRLNIQSGKPWFPFDQIDQSVGVILFTIPFVLIEIKYYLAFFIIYNLIRFIEYFLFDNTKGKLKKRSY